MQRESRRPEPVVEGCSEACMQEMEGAGGRRKSNTCTAHASWASCHFSPIRHTHHASLSTTRRRSLQSLINYQFPGFAIGLQYGRATKLLEYRALTICPPLAEPLADYPAEMEDVDTVSTRTPRVPGYSPALTPRHLKAPTAVEPRGLPLSPAQEIGVHFSVCRNDCILQPSLDG